MQALKEKELRQGNVQRNLDAIELSIHALVSKILSKANSVNSKIKPIFCNAAVKF